MRVIGVRNFADKLGWVVVEGAHRQSVEVMEFNEVTLPNDDRAVQLAWVRREILAVIAKHPVDLASIRVAEAARTGTPNFGRAEVDGVVQAALAELHVPVKSYKSPTVRAAYGKTQALATAAMEEIPCLRDSAKVRREQLAVALAQYPKTV